MYERLRKGKVSEEMKAERKEICVNASLGTKNDEEQQTIERGYTLMINTLLGLEMVKGKTEKGRQSKEHEGR